MPAPQRRRSAGLIQGLLDAPYRFEFFQAVRLLGMHFRRRAAAGAPVAAEPIRFSSSISLGFAPSEIEALSVTEVSPADDDPDSTMQLTAATLTPSFIGLTGNSGALPRYYSELLANRQSLHRDPTAAAFLDIFTNRAVMQFYRAWLKHRPHYQYEQDRRNRYLPMLLSLAGLGSEALRDRLMEPDAEGLRKGVLDESLAYYTATLRNAGKSAHSIGQLLQDYLQIPVRIQQFIGRWFEIPAAQRTALGRPRGALGAGALCGSRVWQRETRLRLVIGPLDKTQFDALLPGGAAARSLAKLLGMLTGVTLEYEVQLVLRRDSAVLPQLSARRAPRLGLDGWLLTRAPGEDIQSVRFEIQPQLH